MFPIHHALRDESEEDAERSTPPSGLQIRHAAGDESPGLRPELSWTHYRLLLGIDNPAGRWRRVGPAQVLDFTIEDGVKGIV